jgi:hypothetical protein
LIRILRWLKFSRTKYYSERMCGFYVYCFGTILFGMGVLAGSIREGFWALQYPILNGLLFIICGCVVSILGVRESKKHPEEIINKQSGGKI